MSASRAFVSGKTPKAFARRQARRAANPNYQAGKLDGWQMNAKQRYCDLERLASHRRRYGPSLGEELAWAKVIANMLRVMHGQVTVGGVGFEVQRLGMPPLNPTIVEVAVREIAEKAWRRYALYTPREAGTLLQVTMDERERAEIAKLDAIDEPSAERKRRLDRERKAEKRAAKAAPKRPTKKAMAEAWAYRGPLWMHGSRPGK